MLRCRSRVEAWRGLRQAGGGAGEAGHASLQSSGRLLPCGVVDPTASNLFLCSFKREFRNLGILLKYRGFEILSTNFENSIFKKMAQSGSSAGRKPPRVETSFRARLLVSAERAQQWGRHLREGAPPRGT